MVGVSRTGRVRNLDRMIVLCRDWAEIGDWKIPLLNRQVSDSKNEIDIASGKRRGRAQGTGYITMDQTDKFLHIAYSPRGAARAANVGVNKLYAWLKKTVNARSSQMKL